MEQGEPEARWYWLDEDRQWKKFMKLDSDLIEIASQSGDKVVKILGGLYEADIDGRAYKKVATGFVRKIMRATWFAEDSKVNEKGEKNCIPFMEDTCQRLEEAYLTEQFGQNIPVGLDFNVVLARDGMHRQIHSSMATEVIGVTRGYKNRTVREATRRRDSEEYVPREQYSYGSVPPIQERVAQSTSSATLPPLRTSPATGRAASGSSTPPMTHTNDTAGTVRNSVFLEGYLHKLGEKFNGWDNRWFVLNADYLVYFSNKSRDKEKGRIALSAVQRCELAPPSSKYGASGTVFMLHTPKRTYQLKASSRRDAEAWVEGLNKNMRGESPNVPTSPVATVDVKQVVSDDKGTVVSVQNTTRPMSGDFTNKQANPMQSSPLLIAPQPLPVSQLPNTPYGNSPGNRMSMPGPSMSPPMMNSPGQTRVGSPQIMNPGMGQQPMGQSPMMSGQGMQPMGQGQMMNPMMNPGMGQGMSQPMGMGQQTMGQSPMMSGQGMQPMGQGQMMGQGMAQPNMNSPMIGQAPPMNSGAFQQMPQGYQGSPLGQGQTGMGQQSMGQSPMMGQGNGQQLMGQQPMGMGQQTMGQSPMMSGQGMPQQAMMGQGMNQPLNSPANYRLSQQYLSPSMGMGQQPMGQSSMMGGQGMPQPVGGQSSTMMQPMGQMNSMSQPMGQVGQGTSQSMMGQGMTQPMGQGQMMGQGMAQTNQASGWPPGYSPQQPSNTQYNSPSYNQYSASPSQSPSVQHYTPSATNPFAQQATQSTAGWPAGYSSQPVSNAQYNTNTAQFGTGYGQQPQTQQYSSNTGAYGQNTTGQMYNYNQQR